MDDEEEAGPSSKLPKPLLHIHGAQVNNAAYAKKHVIRNIKTGKRYQK